jgi:uncharacterized protein (DUF39 family)
VPSRARPVVRKVSYEELKSGKIRINDKDVRTSPLSSFKLAKEIAETLKNWIREKRFSLTRSVELVPDYRDFRPLNVRKT